MQDTIYYLIIVIYYFWYFYVKIVILCLSDLFRCFQVHLILFRLNLIPVMVRYQLGVILDDIFLFVKFLEDVKQAPKSVNIFHSLLSIKIQTCVYCILWWIPDLLPCEFKEPLVDSRFTTQELIIQFLFHQESIVCAFLQASMTHQFELLFSTL